MKKYMLKKIQESFGDSTYEVVRNRVMALRSIRQCEKALKIVQGKSKVLDFGCGLGQNMICLKELGSEVVGLEIKPEESWKKLDLSVVIYGGGKIPYKSGVFDVVFMSGVLEHVGPYPKSNYYRAVEFTQKARIETLIECRRVLKRDGYICIFNFPNKFSLIEMVNGGLNLRARHSGSEKQSLGSVEKLIKDAGFVVKESGRHGVIPFSVGYVWPFVRENFINRHHVGLDVLDEAVDRVLGNVAGQSNYVIAKK